MTKRVTKRDYFTILRAAVDTHPNIDAPVKRSLLAFIDKEVGLLTKKRNTDKTDAKRAAEQVAIMGNIEGVLADADKPMRVAAIAEALADGTSSQRVTAMLSKMVEAGTVERIEGKYPTFRLAE